jgi:hypothetical protein
MSEESMNRSGMRIHTIVLGAACALALTGCGHDIKQQLGLSHPAPDEFAVVKHAPLAMPPDYELRPPRPGMPRPQEQPTNEQAQDVVFGTDSATAASTGSSGADEILDMAGADKAQPHIRQTVDAETTAMQGPAKSAMQKLGLAKPSQPPATVVNAKKESERLKKNAETGKPVTAGDTPSVSK